MYHFPEEIRKAYESQPIALVYDMLVDGKALPILVSDGFCELVGMNRENTMEWFKKGQFERIHPDDVGLVNHVNEIFANKESGYVLSFGPDILMDIMLFMPLESGRQCLTEQSWRFSPMLILPKTQRLLQAQQNNTSYSKKITFTPIH